MFFMSLFFGCKVIGNAVVAQYLNTMIYVNARKRGRHQVLGLTSAPVMFFFRLL